MKRLEFQTGIVKFRSDSNCFDRQTVYGRFCFWAPWKRGALPFERVVFEISIGNELSVYEHPNQEKYPGQKISIVQVDEYVYAVPFVETETEIFLKTILPSRKVTRKYRSP